jgi:hypothetical protein
LPCEAPRRGVVICRSCSRYPTIARSPCARNARVMSTFQSLRRSTKVPWSSRRGSSASLAP